MPSKLWNELAKLQDLPVVQEVEEDTTEEYGLAESAGKGFLHGLLRLPESVGSGVKWFGERMGGDNAGRPG